MEHTRFLFGKCVLFLVSIVFLLLWGSPVQAYYFGDWSTDGYYKSQFGIFTEHKPYNKARYGGSKDNIATAKQLFRWDLNGQISKHLSLVAQVQAVWEPDYPGEKGVMLIDGPMRANYYSSFDWREVTLEYKPTYAHSIKFGRQIINWGEALSGRVLDQCNPVDSRASAGFLSLDETYMPLWMFRGQHDFYRFYSSSIEWVVAPIWQADRYEHSRSAPSDTVVGNGKNTTHRDLASVVPGDHTYRNDPGARYSAKRDNRVNKIFGADVAVSLTGKPSSILGAPYSAGYHASDILYPDDPVRPLTRDEIVDNNLLYPYYYPAPYTGSYEFINQEYAKNPDVGFAFLSEVPLPDEARYVDYTDHNFKNTRFGFKTKSQFGSVEGGISFFQGPGASSTQFIRYAPSTGLPSNGPPYYVPSRYTGQNIYRVVIERISTYGLYGNTTAWGTKWWFEGAYQPNLPYQKDLFGMGFGTNADGTINEAVVSERLHNVDYIDTITTLWGLSREQNIYWLNQFNPFSINFQYTNTYRLENTDHLGYTAFFWDIDRMNHSFLLSLSTSYSYNKYNPSLTLLYYPEGCGLVSASFRYVPEGFNSRLSFSMNVSQYLTGPEFAGGLSLYDNNDSITVGMRYRFY